MSAEDYQLLREQFLALRELPPDARQQALDKLNEPLRGEVESLLASEQACGRFLARDEPPSERDQASATGAETGPFMIPDTVPETIGRYRLLQKIGEGGHGSVYMAAQDEPVRRKVAVKLIKPGMDSKQVLARFHAEQQALAMMDHASIAKVFDAGVSESGTPYFVMELVKGVPIHQFCQQIDASLQERLRLFLQVCDAVHHAHRKGVIHRDLKPSNVLVTMGESEPIAKVIDFGIAKALDQRLTPQTLFTEYGQMIGTLEYMSPEQAEMSAVEIDTRSDVYSLGVLLYQLLTGETPISRDQLLKNGVFEIPRLLRETEPKTPSDRITSRQQSITRVDRGSKGVGLSSLPSGDLDWIALKALAKDRRRRYDSVLDLSRDVQRFLASEPVEAHPPSLMYRASKSLRKHWMPISMATVVLLGTAFGLVGLGVGLVRARHALTLAEQERQAAIAAQEAADASRLELADTVYAELIESAWRATREQRNDRARELLDRCLPALRGWEWSFVGSRIRDRTAWLRDPQQQASVRRLDAHGSSVACVLRGGKVEVWEVATGQRQHAWSFPQRANVVRWSADGAWLFVGTSQGKVVTIRAADGETLSTFEQRQGGIYDICIAAPQRQTTQQIAVCSGSGWVEQFVVDATSATLTSVANWRIPARLGAVTFDAQADQLVGAGLDGQLYLMRAEQEPEAIRVSGSSVLGVIACPDGEVVARTAQGAVVWSADQEPKEVISLPGGASALATGAAGWVAVGGGDGSLYLKQLHSDAAATVIAEYGAAVNDLKWMPQHQQFLVALSDGRMLWADPEGSSADAFSAVRTATTGIVLAARQQLLTFDRTGQMSQFDLATGQRIDNEAVHDAPVWSVACDRDATVLVTVGDDQRIKAWDLPQMSARFSEAIAWGVRDVCVAPDGSWIASAPDPSGDPREGTMAIRDAETGATQRQLVGHENWVLKLAVTPDGKRLASSGEFPNTRIWDVASGEPLVQLNYDHHGAAPQLTIDQRGETLYLGHRDGWVTAWRIDDGTLIGEWPAFGDEISGLAVTADDRVLATSQSSGALRVYDFLRGRQLASLDLGIGFLLRLDLADDDRRLSLIGENRQLYPFVIH